MLSISSLRIALSAERLQAYATSADVDEFDSIARYQWNLALGVALQPGLHFLEICLRNHVFDVSRRIVDESRLKFKAVPCWLDANPSLLEQNEERAVENAKAILSEARKPPTVGRLISKLNFGFWLSLCKRPYEQGRASGPALWPALATEGFPFMKKELRTRAKIFHQLDQIRVIRNRISHHEPIWNRDIRHSQQAALESISWMNLGLAKALAEEASVESVIRTGLGEFRGVAIRHVSVPGKPIV